MFEQKIKAGILSGTLSFEAALTHVDAALAISPTCSLWIMRGRLIQLADVPGFALEDAAVSFLSARDLAPRDPEIALELGHFYDAVMRDRSKAKAFYREAIALGAGEEAKLSLADLGG